MCSLRYGRGFRGVGAGGHIPSNLGLFAGLVGLFLFGFLLVRLFFGLPLVWCRGVGFFEIAFLFIVCLTSKLLIGAVGCLGCGQKTTDWTMLVPGCIVLFNALCCCSLLSLLVTPAKLVQHVFTSTRNPNQHTPTQRMWRKTHIQHQNRQRKTLHNQNRAFPSS